MSKTECGSSQISSEHWKYNISASSVLCILLEFLKCDLQTFRHVKAIYCHPAYLTYMQST